MKFLEKKNDTPIKSLINALVGGPEPARSKKNIHASELTKDPEYCPRQIRLMELTGQKYKDEWVPGVLKMTWDDGRDKQRRINNDYLKDYMVGDWECLSCGAVKKWHRGPPKAGCSGIAKCRWQYVEPFFKHVVSKAQGSIDALVVMAQGLLRVCEIKIIATSMWEKLKAPLAEHKQRTALYLEIIRNSDHPHRHEVRTDEASVLYVLRGHGTKDDTGAISPLREFTVKADAQMHEEPLAKAHAVTMSRVENGPGLPYGVCSHAMCDRAKSCPVVKHCFGEEHQPKISWIKDGKPRHEGAAFVATGKED